MTAPGQPAPDGAYVIGGGGYGQDYNEAAIRSLFAVPMPNPGNALDLLREQLMKMPLEALQAIKDLIPDPIEDAFETIGGAVNAIMDALTDSPVFVALSEFTAFIGDLAHKITGEIGAGLNEIGVWATGIATGLADLLWKLLNNAGAVIGNIATVVVDAASNTLQGVWDWLTHLFNGGRKTATPASGKTVADVVAAADAVSQVTYNTQFKTDTLQGFFSTPRVVPAWISNLSDDAAFAQTLIDGSSAPALGTLVLIPVTVSQDRVYDSIKFGLAATTMTNCYVGLYDVDESTGTCTKVLDLGDVKSSLSTALNLQTIPLGTTISVQRGEVYYIGVLQVGGTAAAMHRWSTTFNFTTGFYPRYMGSTWTTTGVGALPSTFNAGTDIISGTKFWGALGTATTPVAPGSALFTDGFGTDMSAWTLRYGTSLYVSGGRAVQANTYGYMTYNSRTVQAEQEVGATIGLSTAAGSSTSGAAVVLSLRGNGAGKCVYLWVPDNTTGGSNTVSIRTTAAFTDLGSTLAGGVLKASINLGSGTSVTDGDWVFRAVGNTYTAYQDGVERLVWPDSGGSFAYSNSLSELGIGAYSNTSRTMGLDNWYGKDL